MTRNVCVLAIAVLGMAGLALAAENAAPTSRALSDVELASAFGTCCASDEVLDCTDLFDTPVCLDENNPQPLLMPTGNTYDACTGTFPYDCVKMGDVKCADNYIVSLLPPVPGICNTTEGCHDTEGSCTPFDDDYLLTGTDPVYVDDYSCMQHP